MDTHVSSISARLVLATLIIIRGLLLCAQEPPRVEREQLQIEELEFRNQQLRDILLTLAQLGRYSVLFDATVDGSATHFFRNIGVVEAMQLVAASNNLHLEFENGLIRVSKIRIVEHEDESIDIDAEGVSPTQLIDRLSVRAKYPIIYDALPSTHGNFHCQQMSIQRAVQIYMSQFEGYEVRVQEDHIFIAANPRHREPTQTANSAQGSLVAHNGAYSLEGESLRSSQMFDRLFELQGAEYLMFADTDQLIDRARYLNKSFEQMLDILCELSVCRWELQGDMYAIFSLGRGNEDIRHQASIILSLEHVRVSNLQQLLPSGMMGSGNMKIDQEQNRIILNGSSYDVSRTIDFLRRLDVPHQGRSYYRFEAGSLSAQQLIAALPEELKLASPIALPEGPGFIMLCTPQAEQRIREYIRLIDIPDSSVPVRLRYIQSEQLLSHLPPSAQRENIAQSADPSLVFFTGRENQLRDFLAELEHIDQPIPQIRYQVLVIQFQDRQQYDYSLQGSNSVQDSDGDQGDSSYLGSIGNLLSLNFDVVSNFGYNFAVDLNWSLSNSTARVLIDSSITGLSGESLNFSNTNTSRIRSSETVEEDGESVTRTVTVEINSGLEIDISGWTSGDGMITMDVQTSFSQQFEDSDDSANLPSTNERNIETHVRTQSGQAVVIGGLVSQEQSESSDKTPILSALPAIGPAFTGRSKSTENTELRVYIIPIVEQVYGDQSSSADLFASLYRSHMESVQ